MNGKMEVRFIMLLVRSYLSCSACCRVLTEKLLESAEQKSSSAGSVPKGLQWQKEDQNLVLSGF